MEGYIDGFVIPIPTDKVERYKQIASQAGEIWKEHGALAYYECIGDDLDVKDMISFRQAAGSCEEETVIFSWIVYESRDHRDKVNAAVMADPRMKTIMQGMMEPDSQPFDCRRMVYGGFNTLIKL